MLNSTGYQIAINPDFLEEAVELFACLVRDPCFNEKLTKDEVEAIDNGGSIKQFFLDFLLTLFCNIMLNI